MIIWSFTDNYTLDFVVNLLLCCLVLFLYSDCVNDSYWKKRQAYKFFIFWLIISLVQCTLTVFIALARTFSWPQFLSWHFIAAFLFFDNISYLPPIFWILSVNSDFKPFSRKMIYCISILVCMANFIIMSIMFRHPEQFLDTDRLLGGSTLYYAMAVYSIISALVLGVILMKYRHNLLHSTLLVLFLCLLCFMVLDMQTFWSRTPGNIFAVMLTYCGYFAIWRKQKAMFRAQERELIAKDAELTQKNISMMVSQIQPHFLYNTLNSIAYLCTHDPQKARDLTIQFSTYLRGNLNMAQANALIPFSEELQHTKTYLEIELARFSDILHVEYDIQAVDFFVPPLTLQPLVENAVKHGICQKASPGTIRIASYEESAGYRVTVADDGVGFDTDMPPVDPSKHLGISNVRSRVQKQCSGTLTIESCIGSGTISTLYIPRQPGNYDA